MRGFRAIALVAVLVLFGWTLATPAKAALVKKYTYTGNSFDQVEGVFTTDDRVAGYFLIDCDSAGGSGDCSNLPDADYGTSIIDFSFSAGPITLESATSFISDFQLTTDSSMFITSWYIDLQSYPEGSFPTEGITETIVTLRDVDLALIVTRSGGETISRIEGQVSEQPGTWTVETVSVPAPATPYLFPGALIVLLALSRRRRQSSL